MNTRFRSTVRRGLQPSKRGQFEAMGLAVIVILVSLGMFFMLFFSLRSPTDFPDRFNREQASQNFVTAFVNTNVRECPTFTFSDLVFDAALTKKNPCPGEETSLQLVNRTSFDLLNKTFGTEVPYRFRVSVSGTDEPLVQHGTCDPDNDPEVENDAPGRQPIYLVPTPRTANVELILCI